MTSIFKRLSLAAAVAIPAIGSMLMINLAFANTLQATAARFARAQATVWCSRSGAKAPTDVTVTRPRRFRGQAKIKLAT